MMNYKILKDFKQSKWTSGTTTSLYIFPENGDYSSGNFDFRISIATIEEEETTFTPLEGFQRVFTLLEGEVELIHQDKIRSQIGIGEQDVFDGVWLTKSKGFGKPINVIHKAEKKVNVTYFNSLDSSFNMKPSLEFLFFWAIESELLISFKNQKIELLPNELLCIQNDSNLKEEFQIFSKSPFVEIQIS